MVFPPIKLSMWFLCIRSVKETLQISGSLRHYRAIPMVQLRSRDFSSRQYKNSQAVVGGY